MNLNFKTITHYFALGLAGVAAFAVSPAGQSLIKQYPYLSGAFGLIVTLAALYHNPSKTAPVLILIALLFAPNAMAQTPPPNQPFVLSTSGGTFNGQPITIASAGVQLTAETPVAVAVGYQYMFNPSDSTQPHFGGGITDTTFCLCSIVPKVIKSHLLIDLTNYNLTVIAGAGVKSSFNGIGLPRTQHVVGDFGLSPSYPMPGGHVQVAPLYQILLGPHKKTDRVIGGTLNFTF